MNTTDFTVENHGTIALLRPHTDAAKEFLKGVGDGETMHWGDAIVVEPRYLGPILEGAQEEGLTVAESVGA